MEDGSEIILSNTILEGHRFAVRFIKKGEKLTSWNLPFALAISDITPGNYICNDSIIETLKIRNLNIDLPSKGNFEDYIEPCSIEKMVYTVGSPVKEYANKSVYKVDPVCKIIYSKTHKLNNEVTIV